MNWRLAHRTLAAAALDLLFPPTCAGCGDRSAADLPLCPACLAGIDRSDDQDLRAHLEALGREEPPDLAAVFAMWRFDAGGAFQKAHHRLKYGGQPRVGRALGRLLGAYVRGEGPWDAVVWVGQSPQRYLERGYNQAEPIGRGVADALGLPVVPDLLHRAEGGSQTRLSRMLRKGNVAHSFAADARTDGARLLLVDDVLTTGATLGAAARALRGAGARRVDGAVLAWAR